MQMSKSDKQKYTIITACVLFFAAAMLVSALLISGNLRFQGDAISGDGAALDGEPDKTGAWNGEEYAQPPGDFGSDIWAQVQYNLIPDMLALIERQANVDEMLLAELNSGLYTFYDPFVVVDPYGTAPLSALALFNTEEPVRISVHVQGRTELANVDFTFDGYNTSHKIPIFGLYAATENIVILTGRRQNGEESTVELRLQTDVLPPELAGDIILTDLVQPENIQPGFNFTFAYKTAFDLNGDYRWFYNDFFLRGFAMYDYNGHMIFAKGSYHEGDVLLIEVNMLGKILSVFHSPYGMHHDVTSRNGGNLIVNGSRGHTVEDFIYEIDVQTGEIVNTLDLKNVLQRTRIEGFPVFDPVDWFHHNATVYENGYIIISGRRQSAVVMLSWPDGEIRWILSDHAGWNQMFQQYLLTPIGENFEWSYGQHTPTILPDFDGDPDTIDIMLFDNGNGRFDDVWQLYSRMVHYRINERDMTIEQIWQFGKELGFPYFAEGWSSAVLLENGNRLGAFDRYMAIHGGSINTNIVEVNEAGDIIWEAFGTSANWNGSFHVYRIERLPLYTEAANNLHIGTPTRVFIR